MRLKKLAPLALAMTAGLVGLIGAAAPANAAGDTARQWGCAAHWRNTAAWSECTAGVGHPMRLIVICSGSPNYTGSWRYIYGHVDPVDRHECIFKANNAYNQY